MRLPEGWVEVRLGQVLERVETKVDPQSSNATSLFYVGLEDIEGHTGNLLRGTNDVTDAADILSIKTVYQKGDILYGKLRPNLNKVHLAEQDGICSTDIWALRTTKEVIPEFALYYLRSPAVHIRATQLATGANLPRVSAVAFDNIKIPLPTLPEQQRIVDVLRQAVHVDELATHARNQVDMLAKQRFMELFGHPANNNKDFEKKFFLDFGTLDRGMSKHRPRNAPHLFNGPYPFIQTGDVSNAGDWLSSYKSSYSEAGLSQSKLWPKGTLCITIAANIAKAAILEFDACFPDSVVGFTPNEGVSSEYILYCLRFYQEYFEHHAPKSAQMNINLEALRKLRMPMPPESLQLEFSKFVREIRILSMRGSEQAERRSLLLRALISDAFTGELTKQWRLENPSKPTDTIKINLKGVSVLSTTSVAHGSIKVSMAPLTMTPVTPSARHWLTTTLSDFQRHVYEVFIALFHENILLAEDEDSFMAFYEDKMLKERLAEFSYSPNRIRRTLSQLATLGLIAKITLPNTNPLTQEQEYLKAFRPLRDNEQSRIADIERLKLAIARDKTTERYYFEAVLDYETSARAGAGGMFQVVSLSDDEGDDRTDMVEQGNHYASLQQLKQDISDTLGVSHEQVDLDVVREDSQ